MSHIIGKRWHRTAEVYEQYVQFTAGSSVLQYRRVFDILAELEQQEILDSKSESRGRQGYSKYYCLAVPVSVVGDMLPDVMENWDKIRDARFNFVNYPRGSGFAARQARYEDKKTWRKLTGQD